MTFWKKAKRVRMTIGMTKKRLARVKRRKVSPLRVKENQNLPSFYGRPKRSKFGGIDRGWGGSVN